GGRRRTWRGRCQPAHREVPQPAVRPVVHPGPGRQPAQRWGRALAARRRTRRVDPEAEKLRSGTRGVTHGTQIGTADPVERDTGDGTVVPPGSRDAAPSSKGHLMIAVTASPTTVPTRDVTFVVAATVVGLILNLALEVFEAIVLPEMATDLVKNIALVALWTLGGLGLALGLLRLGRSQRRTGGSRPQGDPLPGTATHAAPPVRRRLRRRGAGDGDRRGHLARDRPGRGGRSVASTVRAVEHPDRSPPRDDPGRAVGHGPRPRPACSTGYDDRPGRPGADRRDRQRGCRDCGTGRRRPHRCDRDRRGVPGRVVGVAPGRAMAVWRGAR